MTATAEKNLVTLSAAELELELRRMDSGEIREQMCMIEAGVGRELSPAAREAAGVWHEMCWHVATGRDTRGIAGKWDQISRRYVRAENGKPENLRAHNNTLLIRAAHNGRRNWDVCLHEAAHAIVAHSFAVEVEDVTVWRSDGPASVTVNEGGSVDWGTRVMCRVAAHEALQLADIPTGYHCRSDLKEAHEIAKDALGTDRKAAAKVKELSERVRDMLTQDKYARQLLTVATALSERNSLSGDEFRELLGA